MSPNLVAIAGVPPSEATPRRISRRRAAAGVGADDPMFEEKKTMWLSLAALGVGALFGYYALGDLARGPR